MGGSSIDDWELPETLNRTVVLVGRTGNGKSATGNTILGRKAFKSRASSSGVTSTCDLQKTVLHDGQTISVIDTPGFFDFSEQSELHGDEIIRCIDLAKNGIHAILLVLSVRTRFSKEEQTAIDHLQTLFGSKIVNYMIVVFTGGDELEDSEETLEDYLGRECPDPLKEILSRCENRCLLVDNKTKDELKKREQVQDLFSLVDMVILHNDGKPFMDELFELQKGAVRLRDQTMKLNSTQGYSEKEISEMTEQINKSYEVQMKHLIEMVESRLNDTTTRLEQQLAVEQAARLKAEERAQEAQKCSNEEIRKLRESLARAQKENEEARTQAESGRCSIL